MTEIWAHRGASTQAPENTLEAFELAIQQQADGIELDVQMSADHVVVVCHDETIERVSTGSGALSTMTLDQLRGYRYNAGMAGFDATIPTLAEVLDLIASTGLRINIELKNSLVPQPGLEAAVEAAVSASRLADEMAERVVYSSFNHHSLAHLAASRTPAELAVLHVKPLPDAWAQAIRLGAKATHPQWTSLDEADVAAIHAAGLKVRPWTLDEPDQIRLALARGVDAIITNTPEAALRMRAGG